eukprot:scaffold8163_cov258-Pinguiococcus_pyrenoidosus.AAC.3
MIGIADGSRPALMIGMDVVPPDAALQLANAQPVRVVVLQKMRRDDHDVDVRGGRHELGDVRAVGIDAGADPHGGDRLAQLLQNEIVEGARGWRSPSGCRCARSGIPLEEPLRAATALLSLAHWRQQRLIRPAGFGPVAFVPAPDLRWPGSVHLFALAPPPPGTDSAHTGRPSGALRRLRGGRTRCSPSAHMGT